MELCVGDSIILRKRSIYKNNRKIVKGIILKHEEEYDILGMTDKDEYTIKLEDGNIVILDLYAGIFDKYIILSKN